MLCYKKLTTNQKYESQKSAENLLIDIMQYKPPFKSKATQWGINKEPLARKAYEQRCKKEHITLSMDQDFLFQLSMHF